MATAAAPHNEQNTLASLRSTALTALLALAWGAVMCFVFGIWLRTKYDPSATGQRMVATGLLFAAAAAAGLAIWQAFTLWFKKETPDQKAAGLDQQKRIFSYVFIGAGFAMIALAFYVGMGRRASGNLAFMPENFAESFGTLLFGLIAIYGGYVLQRPVGYQGLTLEFLVEKVPALKMSQLVISAAAIGAMVYLVYRNQADNAYITYLPELALLLGISIAAIMGFLLLNSGPMDENGVRRFVLLVGGLTGLCIFLWSVWRTIAWRDDIFLGGATAWSGENSYRFWLCAYVMFFSFILMFVSFNLARADMRTDVVLRRIMFGYDTILQTLLLVGILYVFNVVFYAMVPFTFDWTKARGVYSLASSSKKLIEGLKNETHFVVLMTAGSPPYRDLQVMLENCQSLNNKFMVDYVSPDTDAESYRQLARNFKKILPEQRFRGDTSGRGVLIVNGPMPDKPDHKVPYTFVPERKLYEYERGGPDSGGQYVFKAEDELLKELKFLLQDRAKRKIYFLQGNGEPTIGQAKAERRGQYRQSFQDVGVRFIVEKLKRDNYDVAGLTFDREPEKGKGDDIVPAKEEGPKKQKEIPEDCHTLILAGVSKTLPDEIVESIRRYMERGGKVGSRLMVFLDVVADPAYAKLVDTGLEPMLKRFGVEVTNEIAMGRMMHKNDDPGIVIASPPSGSENVLASQFVNDDYYFAGFARILKPASSGRFKAETILELRKRAQGLNEIIKQTDPKVLQNPQGYMMDLQKAGNVVQYQMLLSQTPEPVAVAVTEDGKPRVVVFGDTEFITDREMLVGQSNRENYALFLSALEWMAEKDSIGTRPRITTSYRFPAAARSMVYRMIFLPTWLMLLGIVSLGVCTWVVRRR